MNGMQNPVPAPLFGGLPRVAYDPRMTETPFRIN